MDPDVYPETLAKPFISFQTYAELKAYVKENLTINITRSADLTGEGDDQVVVDVIFGRDTLYSEFETDR
jgi:hypothetical protein